MDGYVTSKDGRCYAVIYEGLDPTTGPISPRGGPAGSSRRVRKECGELEISCAW